HVLIIRICDGYASPGSRTVLSVDAASPQDRCSLHGSLAYEDAAQPQAIYCETGCRSIAESRLYLNIAACCGWTVSCCCDAGARRRGKSVLQRECRNKSDRSCGIQCQSLQVTRVGCFKQIQMIANLIARSPPHTVRRSPERLGSLRSAIRGSGHT